VMGRRENTDTSQPRAHPLRRLTIVFLVLIASATLSGGWVWSVGLEIRATGLTVGGLGAAVLGLGILGTSFTLLVRIVVRASADLSNR